MGDRKEKETLECPFCGEETINVVKKESFNASRRGFGGDFTMDMISTDCSNCGKERKEVRKKLKKKGFPV